jgi:hypothetical protein
MSNVTIEELDSFTLRFIDKMRRVSYTKETKSWVTLDKPYDGIHSVYSLYNETMRKKFGVDPVEHTTSMVARGLIRTWNVKGGVMLFDARNNRPATKVIGKKIQRVLDFVEQD